MSAEEAEAEAHAFMRETLAGAMDPARLRQALVTLRARTPTADELAGFARAMRAAAVPFPAAPGSRLLDTCGTGGSPIPTSNLSTPAAFVAAAVGAPVAKHGNRSVTRPSGSADLLEALGARIDLAPEAARAVLDEAGFTFLFAPRYHPALRHAAAVRKELGGRTVFNLLGPLCNPAAAAAQVLGVAAPGLAQPMAQALARLGGRDAFVVHGEPGLDEATSAGPLLVVHVQGGRAGPAARLDPAALGLARCAPAALGPVPASQAAALARAGLAGRAGARSDAIALTAALGLCAARRTGLDGVGEALREAQGAMRDGSATAIMERYVAATRSQP